ncbi:MAG: hypothetical protein R6U89_12290 [Dehalococcoidia bacterium]
MTRGIELVVNDMPIEIDYFVQSFIDHTVGAMIESLEETGPIKHLEVSIRGQELEIMLNGGNVPVNSFVNDLIIATIKGMVSSLKGVGEISTLKIAVSR